MKGFGLFYVGKVALSSLPIAAACAVGIASVYFAVGVARANSGPFEVQEATEEGRGLPDDLKRAAAATIFAYGVLLVIGLITMSRFKHEGGLFTHQMNALFLVIAVCSSAAGILHRRWYPRYWQFLVKKDAPAATVAFVASFLALSTAFPWMMVYNALIPIPAPEADYPRLSGNVEWSHAAGPEGGTTCQAQIRTPNDDRLILIEMIMDREACANLKGRPLSGVKMRRGNLGLYFAPPFEPY
jgi:hypothetical protein